MSDDLIHGTELCVCVSSQEPSVMTEDDNGSDNSQFTGSTINLQDLEWASCCRSLMDLTLQFTPTKHTTFPGLWEHFLDMLGKGVDMSSQQMHLEKKKWLFVDKYFWSSFLYQNQTWEQSRVKDHVRHFVSLCPVGFDSYGVYSMVPHRHSCTHTVCCLCSSCLTDTLRCAFLHRRVICFICCYYNLISVLFFFVRFIFVLRQ